MRAADTLVEDEGVVRSEVRPCPQTRAPLPTLETIPRATPVLVDVWDEAYARAPTHPALLVEWIEPERFTPVPPLAGARYRRRASWPRLLRVFVMTIALANVVLVAWIVATQFQRLFDAW